MNDGTTAEAAQQQQEPKPQSQLRHQAIDLTTKQPTITQETLDHNPKYRCCCNRMRVERGAYGIAIVGMVAHLLLIVYKILIEVLDDHSRNDQLMHVSGFVFLSLAMIFAHYCIILAQRNGKPSLYVPYLIYNGVFLSALLILCVLISFSIVRIIFFSYPNSNQDIFTYAIILVPAIAIYAWFFLVVWRAHQYMKTVQSLTKSKCNRHKAKLTQATLDCDPKFRCCCNRLHVERGACYSAYIDLLLYGWLFFHDIVYNPLGTIFSWLETFGLLGAIFSQCCILLAQYKRKPWLYVPYLVYNGVILAVLLTTSSIITVWIYIVFLTPPGKFPELKSDNSYMSYIFVAIFLCVFTTFFSWFYLLVWRAWQYMKAVLALNNAKATVNANINASANTNIKTDSTDAIVNGNAIEIADSDTIDNVNANANAEIDAKNNNSLNNCPPVVNVHMADTINCCSVAKISN